ncbi:MAG TPA: DUF1449 family protein [Roseiflexaceae bacterium]|nr:DUF1449 family protein [Roseiflexaceae bacterium]HMP42271.1 DUF1449 family protein [Roseiflexaceae bacterium]
MGFLFAGYNIPFLVALTCAVVLALLQIFAGFGDTDSSADGDESSPNGTGALAWLGVGRMPLTLVLIALLGSFGAIGLIVNTVAVAIFAGYPDALLLPVLLGSLLLALPFTARLSSLLARLAPSTSTAIRHEHLVGRVGIVVSAGASDSYGRVQVRDIHGSTHTVYAVVEDGPSIPEQAEVALVRYDEHQRRFVIKPMAESR